MKRTKQTGVELSSSLVVVCTSVGNPDFYQDPKRSISPRLVKAVSTFAEASRVATDYISEWDLGGGNWTGAQVLHPTKGLIARVSYNGSVWKCTDLKKFDFLKAEKLQDLNVSDY